MPHQIFVYQQILLLIWVGRMIYRAIFSVKPWTILFLMGAFSMCFSAYASWSGSWQAKGSDAIIGLSTEPGNPDEAKNAFLIIGYSKKFDCKPVVSSLVMTGQKVGSPIRQKTSKSLKSQLIVRVDGKDFTTETKMTEYSNGVELAMRSPDGLIEALSSPNSLFTAYIGKTTTFEPTKANSISAANAKAKSNCK